MLCVSQNHHYEHKPSYNRHDPPNGPSRSPLVAQNGNFASFGIDTSSKPNSNGGEYVNGPAGALSRSYGSDDSPDTMPDDDHEYGHDHDHEHDEDQDERHGRGDQPHKRSKEHAELSDEESKWIHRDKLAKIESEELQAAGIILPHPRSRSRSRRERSQSSTKRMGPDNYTRSRKNSSHTLEPKTPETSAALNGAEDGDGDVPARPLTGSRIPVPKKSPLPISASQSRENSPEEQEKRIEPARTRPRSNSTTLKSLEPPATLKAQPGKRAATDISPKKPAAATVPRKTTAPAKTIPPEARGKVKPKSKNGSNGSNNTRPNTRSGERELSTGSWGSKPMEGEPPWMVSAYKPDPRLPPDQQLLPTVAKRLQQEKWEQEGKFGNVYDKDFRPLTDEGFLSPPANMPSSSTDNIIKQEVEKPDEWPLRSPEPPKSPASIGRSSTYSTMPKIQDKPNSSPIPSPKPPSQPVMPSPPPRPQQPQQQPQPTQITRVPDASEKEQPKVAKKKDGGCGCCVVM